MAWHRAADPVDPEEAFLQAVTGQVRFRPDRAAIAEELRAHLDESARDLDTMSCSAGKIGRQVELAPGDLAGLIGARFAPVAK